MMLLRAVAAIALIVAGACGRSPERAARTGATPARADVPPDLEKRLARWKAVPMPFAMERLAECERRLVEKLIGACRPIEDIFWQQSDPEGAALYNALGASAAPRDKAVRRLLWVNGARFDLLDENRPFVGKAAMPPGRALYPQGLTRAEIEAYVAAHPDEKTGIYGERTVVVRRGERLEAIPYHVAYKAFLDPAPRALKEDADFSDDPAFARYLRLRADALSTDDYYPSDVAWVELENPKFDLILAPYETYLDDLLGVKTSYGAAVLVRDEGESARLEKFRKFVPELQKALPLPPEDRPSKRGRAAPMEVMDAPYRSGDLRHGYQAVADNLPNDPRIHQEKGSKRLFFKNFMDARVNVVILPIARRLMREDQAPKATGDGYLTTTIMHEIAHGLGPAFARQDGKQADIREAIGPVYSGLEEAKAD